MPVRQIHRDLSTMLAVQATTLVGTISVALIPAAEATSKDSQTTVLIGTEDPVLTMEISVDRTWVAKVPTWEALVPIWAAQAPIWVVISWAAQAPTIWADLIWELQMEWAVHQPA